VKSVNSKRIENRIIKKTPATTRVEEWIRAEAGVGASIASGNQTWAKNCAALIPPERTKHIEKNVKKCHAVCPMKR
jgi:transcriptional regulator with AAA-type ATPase domain